MEQAGKSSKLTVAAVRKLEADLSKSREDTSTNLSSMQQSMAHTQNAFNALEQRVQRTEDSHSSLEDAIEGQTSDGTAFGRRLQTLGEQLETQAAISERLAATFTNEISEGRDIKNNIQEVRSVFEKNQKVFNSCTEAIHQVRTEQSSLNSRLCEIEQRRQHETHLPNGSVENQLAPSDLERIKERLDTMFQDLSQTRKLESEQRAIQERLSTLSQDQSEMKQQESRRDEMTAKEIDSFYDSNEKQKAAYEEKFEALHDLHEKQKAACEERFETQQGWLDQISADQAACQKRVEAISADQASCSASVEYLKDEVSRITRSLLSEKEAQRPLFDQLQSDMSTLQRQIKDEVHPKIKALESSLRCFEDFITDKVKAMESFLATQESRWNNMTTEPIVNSILYRMKQLYPVQYWQNEIHQMKLRQEQLEVNFHQLVNNGRDEDRKKLHELAGSIQTAQDEVRGTATAHEELKGNVAQLKIDLRHMAQKVEGLERQQKVPSTPDTESVASLRRDLQRNLDERISVLESESGATFETLKNDVANQQNLSQDLKSGIELLQNRIGSTEEAIRDRTVSRGEFQALQTSLGNIEKDLQARLSNVEKDLPDYEFLKGELQTLRTPVNSMNQERESRNGQMVADKLVRQLEDRIIEPMKSDIRALQTSASGVQKDHKTLECNVQALLKDLEMVKQASVGNVKRWDLQKNLESMEQRWEDFWKAQKQTHTATEKNTIEVQALQERVKEVYDTGVEEIAKIEGRVHNLEVEAGKPDINAEDHQEVDETQENFVSAPEDDKSDPYTPRKTAKRRAPHKSSSPAPQPPNSPSPRRKRRKQRHHSDSESYSESERSPSSPPSTRKATRSTPQQVDSFRGRRGGIRPGAGRPRKH